MRHRSRRLRTVLLYAAVFFVLGSPVYWYGWERPVVIEYGTRTICKVGNHLISEDVSTVRIPVKRARDFQVKVEVDLCWQHAIELKEEGDHKDETDSL